MRTYILLIACCLYGFVAQAQTTEKQIFFAKKSNPFSLPESIRNVKDKEVKIDNGEITPIGITMKKTDANFRVCPEKEGSCKISVISAGKTIWEEVYEVRPFSNPMSIVLTNEAGKQIDLKNTLPCSITYKVSFISDGAITKHLKLHNIILHGISGTIYRQNRAFKEFGIFPNTNTPFNFQDFGVKPNDKVVLECKNAQRIVYYFDGRHGHEAVEIAPVTILFR